MTTTIPAIRLGSARFPSIRKFLLDDSTLRRHMAIYGPDRDLRHRHLQDILAQQARRNGGWLLFIDEDDRAQLAALQSIATAAGRADDFYVVDLADPSKGHGYNPLFGVPPSAAAKRVVGLTDPDQAGVVWTQMAGSLIQAVFDYAFRRGQHLKLATLQVILERHQTFFPVLMADPATRRLLQHIGFAADGSATSKTAASVLAACVSALQAIIYSNGFLKLDVPARQVDLADIMKNDLMCVVVVPSNAGSFDSRGNASLRLLAADLYDAAIKRVDRSAKARGPAFLTVLADAKHLRAGLGQSFVGLAQQARGLGIGLIQASEGPGVNFAEQAVLDNTTTTVWHSGMLLPSRGRDEGLTRRLEAIKADSFIVLCDGKESPLLRIPPAQPNPQPFQLPHRETEFAVHLELNAKAGATVVDILLESQP